MATSDKSFNGELLESIFKTSKKTIQEYVREIELADLGTLMLKDYDALCGEKRTYYPVRKMAHKRALLENKRKSDNQKKGGNTYEGK